MNKENGRYDDLTEEQKHLIVESFDISKLKVENKKTSQSFKNRSAYIKHNGKKKRRMSLPQKK